MAPRRTNRAKGGSALAPVDMNASTAMTPRRAEVTALKDENETLKAQMANLTATLARIEMKETTPAVATVAATSVTAIQAPTFSMIQMPPAPAKPATAYSMFCADARTKISGLSGAEMLKEMGAGWKALTEEQKKPYADMAANDRARHEGEMKRYNAQVAKIQLERDSLAMLYDAKKKEVAVEYYEQQMAAAAAVAAGVPIQKKKAVKKEPAAAQRVAPKKARTAYQLFAADRREAIGKKAKDGEKVAFGEVMKQVGEEWAKLEKTKPGQKKLQKYADLAAADKERYAGELQAFTEAEEAEAASARAVAARQLEADKREAMRVYAPQVRLAAEARTAAAAARGEKKARKAERAGQPPRAKSAYIFFGMGERAAVAADMPGASQATIMAELGRRWKVAGEEQRAQYVRMAEEDKARYAEEMAAFKKE